jgi:NADPH-dependent curcumin reductase CurA
MTRKNRQILLTETPMGKLEESHFKTVESETGEPGDGEVLCRNVLLSIDPANRAWMRGRTYRDQVMPGDVMAGYSLMEVVAGDGIAAGTVVMGEGGWQEYALMRANQLQQIPVFGDLTHHMSVLGITGLTAYFGLLKIGQPKSGETVVVSAAAGATGNVVGQIAKLKGCRVVGIAGSDEKNAMLESELDFDATVNYKNADFRGDLKEACPNGIDVYFDNVGGQVFKVVLPRMNQRGRVVCCGSVSGYDATSIEPGSPLVPGVLVVKRLLMQGFIVMDYADEWAQAGQELAGWIASGEIKVLQDVVEGLDQTPKALIGLLAGDNVGKRLVRIGPDPA